MFNPETSITISHIFTVNSLHMCHYLADYPLVNYQFDPGSHRGWKISFHLEQAIFRVYVNLPEGNILIQSSLPKKKKIKDGNGLGRRWSCRIRIWKSFGRPVNVNSGQEMWAQTGCSSTYREHIHHKP